MPGAIKLRNSISAMLELPREVMLDVPIFRLVGNDELFIENFKGLVEYSLERVRIKTSVGILKMEGVGLSLKHVTREDLLIKGKIVKIEFLN